MKAVGEYLSTSWRALLLIAGMLGLTVVISLHLQAIFEMGRQDEEDRNKIEFCIIDDKLIFTREK